MWFDWRAGDHGSAHGQPRSHIYTKCNCRIPAGIFGVPRCFQLFGRARHSKQLGSILGGSPFVTEVAA